MVRHQWAQGPPPRLRRAGVPPSGTRDCTPTHVRDADETTTFPPSIGVQFPEGPASPAEGIRHAHLAEREVRVYRLISWRYPPSLLSLLSGASQPLKATLNNAVPRHSYHCSEFMLLRGEYLHHVHAVRAPCNVLGETVNPWNP